LIAASTSLYSALLQAVCRSAVADVPRAPEAVLVATVETAGWPEDGDGTG
jgi:hypothetical protein